MASSVIILKSVIEYSLEETIKSFKKSIIDSGMTINNINMEYDSNKNIVGAEGCIGFVDSDNDLKQFLFTINNIDAYSEDSFEWLVPGKKLFWAVDIENIGGAIVRYLISQLNISLKIQTITCGWIHLNGPIVQ